MIWRRWDELNHMIKDIIINERRNIELRRPYAGTFTGIDLVGVQREYVKEIKNIGEWRISNCSFNIYTFTPLREDGSLKLGEQETVDLGKRT